MTYVTKVELVDGGISVVFPHELLEKLDLQDGEVLEWKVDEKGDTFTVTKTRFIYNGDKK